MFCYYIKICPPLRSTSVDISICSRKGGKVSCQEVVLPGTKATLSCKPSYKISVTNDPGYREITCLDDGTWDNHIFRYLPGIYHLHLIQDENREINVTIN